MSLAEDDVRRIVREEIAEALRMLAREAYDLDMPYETQDLDTRALDNIRKAAEGAASRLLCEHEYRFWLGRTRCTRCGEPPPEPANPFEEKS